MPDPLEHPVPPANGGRLRLRTAVLRDALDRGDRAAALLVARETESTHGTPAMLRLVIEAAYGAPMAA
jgi:hypothetical protein